MQIVTLSHLDSKLWPEARRIYHQAFSRHGRKPDPIIEGMFARKLSLLHIGELDGEAAAMAISGEIREANVLLIDYLAVRENMRGRGIGKAFVSAIARWAKEERKLDGIIIEAESEPTPENEDRIRFWERCGFTRTSYVHQYIWVPEPYLAMYLSFKAELVFPTDGETLFRYIGSFHAKAFRPKSKA